MALRLFYVILCAAFLIAAAPPQAQPDPASVAVLIALRDIPRGLLITDDLLSGEGAIFGVAYYPPESLPFDALRDLSALSGYVTRVDLPREQPIIAAYLWPHPLYLPNETALPLRLGLRTVREYGVYQEYRVENLAQLRYPTGLASGDRVAIMATTGLGDPLQDETRPLLPDVIIAQVSAEGVSFSLAETERRILQSFLSTGLGVTLLLHPQGAPSDFAGFNAGSNLIQWDYLLERANYPVDLPEDADLSNIRG